MKYLTKSEVDASFDVCFDSEEFPFRDRGLIEPIKQFISSLRTSDLDALIEHCKGKKMENLKEESNNDWFYGVGHNAALKDEIAFLTSLKETNK